MERPSYIPPDFPADAFAGTAMYYARYRLPYPSTLIADLLQRASITAGGRLLDLAAGPGRIAIPLAGHFREVWAVDLEPEMTAVGEQEARQRGVTNIRWITGKAEELVAEPDSFDLITIGDAFHRLDQQLIAACCRQWLRPGGCLAILGCNIVTNGPAPWQRAVADTVRHWRNLSLPEGKPSGGRSTQPRPGKGPDHNAAVLRDAGFAEVAGCGFVHPHDWTIESILGHLYSTSHCSRRLLGKNAPAFERDLEQVLLKCDPSGRYHQDLDCGYTLGQKPAGAGLSAGSQPPQSLGINRRPATAADEQFLRELHKAAYREVVVRQFGQWDDEFQAGLFSQKWIPERFEVLESDGRAIGCIRVDDQPEQMFLAEIQLLPDFQGRGIGSELIQGEIARARHLQKPLRLQVLKSNDRARALYERLGFRVCGTTDRHFVLSIT